MTYRLSETSFTQDYAQDLFKLKNHRHAADRLWRSAFNSRHFSAVGSISQAIGATDENLQFTDNFSIIRGKHNVRDGISDQPASVLPGDQLQRQSDLHVRWPLYRPADHAGSRPRRLPARRARQRGRRNRRWQQDMRTNFYGAYIQDDWRILPNFTINIGMRYEFARSPVEINNHSLFFNTALRKVVLAGQGVRPDIVDPDYNNWAPRFGFNWSPKFVKNFVVRGGSGIFYATDNFNEEQFKVNGPPFFQAQTLSGDARTPNLFMRDMLPSFHRSPRSAPLASTG